MLSAMQPLGSLSHSPASFTSTTASPARLAPRRRRSGARRSVSKVSCRSTSLAEANGDAVGTVVTVPATRLRVRHDEEKITLKATVKVHLKSLFAWQIKEKALDEFERVFHRQWLQLELFSSELDPQTGEEREPVSNYGKYSHTDGTEFFIYEATFSVPASFGAVGAVRVENGHHREMYITDIVVRPDGGGDDFSAVTFHCNSWISFKDYNPADKRFFFPLKSYLPSETPNGVERLRKEELHAKRGDGSNRARGRADRVYDYDVYNDLGDPNSNDPDTKRPVLGGKDRPYPRRCRTGGHHSNSDPYSEVRAANAADIYVPRDERFTDRKAGAFFIQLALSGLHATWKNLAAGGNQNKSFPSLAAIEALYNDGYRNKLDQGQETSIVGTIVDLLHDELTHLLHRDGHDLVGDVRQFFRFKTPEIHDKDKFAWFRDEEFARETLAGMNPLSIQLVTELDQGPFVEGDDYLITKELIESQINGAMTAEEAIENKKLFMLDYHDMFLPFVNTVRELEHTTLYASRTLFFLTDKGTLQPIGIELTRPKSQSKKQWRRVFTPGSDAGVTGSWLWQLAKTHVLAHDTGYHQLVSHWLRTHCCVEPYIIAANRQLSEMHPIYRLLHPHFRFTMEINALARGMLVNADGIIEKSFSPGKYCMELSSAVYDQFWRFDMEALPADLIRRGMAFHGENGELEPTIKDYPYATDGLLVWKSIEEWASDYVKHYYRSAADITGDEELQGWWTEVRTKGHADKQDEPWWPELDSHESLVQVLTTIMWVTSGHHAAVNFGQYPYSGYFPNRPTIARRNMPTEDDAVDEEFERDPEKVLLDTFPSQLQSTTVLTVLNVLSTHAPGEEYIGTHTEPAWVADAAVNAKFERFKGRMMEVVGQIDEWNNDRERRNRNGAGVLPYVLLKPSYGDPKDNSSMMEKGIPNSISI